MDRADLIRRLEAAEAMVELEKRRWHMAAPHQAATAYERYRAAQEYLDKLRELQKRETEVEAK
jgi:hypothetical protein